jgi:hypothetical protein
MRRIMTALRALLPGRARRADGEPDRKFAFHLDEGTAKHMRAGASPDEARRRALVAFGGRGTHTVRWSEAGRVRPVPAGQRRKRTT